MYELVDGLVSILAGIYAYLAVTGKVKVSKNEEKAAEWRQKYGRLFKIAAPILVLFGLFKLGQLLLSAVLVDGTSSKVSAQTPQPRPDDSGSVRIAHTYHILVKDEATARNLRAAITALPSSEQFAKFKAIAQSSSIDPGSSGSGGDLGAVFEGEMVKSFETAIFRSRAKEVTGPFQSEFGWHLSYVTEFRSRPVGEICRSSLEASIQSANANDKPGLAIGLEPIDRESFPDKIMRLIGPGWRGPLMDSDRNLLYIAASSSELTESVRLVVRHTEYVHGKLVVSPRPMACARSLRDGWAIDCKNKRVGLAEFSEFEGRAASGRKLTDVHHDLSNIRFMAVGGDPAKLNTQLYEHACKSGSLL
ncbi:MAG TPA: peptidylprolyl isomerase [Burkholderiales bacterium]|nr:peptidylprolyl isomerase [Burkholderiales bacterium]